MIARCMVIAPNRHPVKIKAKDYEEFREATNIWGSVGSAHYDYYYAIPENCDSKESRLSYIDYLVNRKWFNI